GPRGRSQRAVPLLAECVHCPEAPEGGPSYPAGCGGPPVPGAEITMPTKKFLLLSAVLSAAVPLFLTGVAGLKPVHAAGETREIATDGKIVMGPAITPQQVRSPDHPGYPRGWTCAECHDVSFGVDIMSTASRQY